MQKVFKYRTLHGTLFILLRSLNSILYHGDK